VSRLCLDALREASDGHLSEEGETLHGPARPATTEPTSPAGYRGDTVTA
jgi:hypothetical protein